MQILNLVRGKAWWMAICMAPAIGAAALGTNEQPSDLILDLFVQKGFVTQQEADKVKAEAEALRTNEMQMPPLPESKWKISKALKDVELFGDVRLRYEDRSADDPAGNSLDLQRFRYSVRVGLRGDLFDDFYYGVRVDTGDNPRSAWVSFGTSSSSAAYQGPFGKSTAGINVGQAYLGWRPWPWVDLTLGKMPNPLYTTPMVWDPDLDPEGAAERFKYTIGPADFFATFGQLIYATFAQRSVSGNFGLLGLGSGQTQNLDSIFQLAWQAGLQYHFTTNVSAKVAATVYQYLGLQRSMNQNNQPLSALSPYFGDPYVGEGAYLLEPANTYAPGYSGYAAGQDFSSSAPGYGSLSFPFNQVGLNHLLVVELPFELDFKLWKLDARMFGDFAYNLEGAKRAEDAAAAYTTLLAYAATHGAAQASASPFSPQKNDVKAYQIGFDLASPGGCGLISGATARKGAWEFKTYWQHVEQYALDPNLIDSDIFEGRENLEGIYVALAYGFTDNLIATVRYGHASRINDLLGNGGSNQDLPWINPINSFDLYQVDLTFKF
ncbi:MAG: putative porin [Verrucomicrobiota bacterium]|nr:putative porin [Verrucomicrobiota bacterium]